MSTEDRTFLTYIVNANLGGGLESTAIEALTTECRRLAVAAKLELESDERKEHCRQSLKDAGRVNLRE